ncbi:hypothetical protein EJ02DRAFT_53021 [Clathrospora elynae]|uniref:Uncharacterized protein n=1 Tax=Clathrospora elynae TaxID=706981 RepID=A0A6A5SXF4_9PLEO|nr:hypothetical protein EJ02DRAFT_53021 [Clathrospora elynae]
MEDLLLTAWPPLCCASVSAWWRSDGYIARVAPSREVTSHLPNLFAARRETRRNPIPDSVRSTDNNCDYQLYGLEAAAADSPSDQSFDPSHQRNEAATYMNRSLCQPLHPS